MALALGLAAAAAPAGADPARWEVEPAGSAVAFDYSLNGEARSGRFLRLAGYGLLDPADPASARFELRIETASIDLGNALFSAFATSAEWFDASNHPEVLFRLSRLRPLGGERYEAAGELAIRGRRLPVTAAVTLAIGAAEARAEASAAVDRVAYGIGVGPSALVVEVGREIVVRVALAARPAAAE